jgi:hypothetical protein
VSATLRRRARWACLAKRANSSLNTALGRWALASERVAAPRLGSYVVEPHVVACQLALQLTQARSPGQLTVNQSHELALRRQAANQGIRPMLANQPVKLSPWNMLKDAVKNAILMAHGVDLLLVSRTLRKRLGASGINAVRPVHKNPTGQPWDKAGLRVTPAHSHL